MGNEYREASSVATERDQKERAIAMAIPKVLVLTLCKFFTAREERIGFTDLIKGFK